MPTLGWLNREQALAVAGSVPYRLLEHVSGHGDPAAENLLIQGDNLEALKALLPFYRGRVKCIYIDPPYNTKSAFEHYDDNLEHSQWLSMMYPRLVLLRELLAEEGSVWVSIDDNEGHYLKVLMDEVFSRKHFLAEIIWQKRTSRENRAAIGSAHDTLLAYAKVEPQVWKQYRQLLPPTGTGYSNPDGDTRGPWRSNPFSAQGYRANQMYKIEAPDGTPHDPPRGRCWAATEPEYLRLKADNRIYFPRGGKGFRCAVVINSRAVELGGRSHDGHRRRSRGVAGYGSTPNRHRTGTPAGLSDDGQGGDVRAQVDRLIAAT